MGRRTTIRTAVVVAAAFLAGLVLRTATHEQPSPVNTADAFAPADDDGTRGPGPTSIKDGIASGFARSQDGARAAAGRIVLAGGPLLAMTPTEAASVVRSMSAGESADGLVTSNARDTQAVLDRVASGSGPVRFDQAVLSTAIDAYTDERVRVRVWSVGVVSRTDAAPPQAGWRTSTIDLVWERDDWRLWGISVSSGPTPALNGGAGPVTTVELDRALDGFEPWRTLP